MRPLKLAAVGAIAALVCWLVSEPYAPTAAAHGVRVGSVQFSLGSFYGWFAHGLLGGLIVGLLSLTVNLERMRPWKAVLWGLLGFAIGALFGWWSDATSDRLMIAALQKGGDTAVRPMLDAIWAVAVSMFLALGVWLACTPTTARLVRMLAGGLVAGILCYMAREVLEPLALVGALLSGRGGGGWRPYEVYRLVQQMLIGSVLGLAIGLAETLMTIASVRLVLGRNEGKTFPLGSGVNRIGCAEGIEVPIFDRSLAPVQATIVRHAGQFAIHATAQPSQMIVNGHPTDAAVLRHGDVVQLGSNTLQFLTRGQAAYSVQPQPAQMIPQPVVERPPAVRHRLVDSFGTVTELNPGASEIGRDTTAAVALPYESSVSRRHAEIVVSGDSATVRDLGSTNGTRVNGVAVTSAHTLADGDTVELGKAKLTYRSK